MQLNHKFIGEGKPVIILHGLFGMLDNWQSFGKKLSEKGYMAILIDQRDHGRSPFTNDFSYELLANDLSQFLDDHWIFKTSIIGHSMGGKAAMNFALQNQDRVDKLIIVDVGIKQYKDGHSAIFNALQSIDTNSVVDRDEVYLHLKSNLDEEEGTIQFLMKNLSRKKDGGYEWKMNVNILKEKYSNILAKIESDTTFPHETLFVRGSKSSYILDEDWMGILDLFPMAQLKTIVNAGHWVHADKPDELLTEVLNFLQ